MRLTGALSRSAVDEFLTTTAVPMRLGCRTPDDHPWMLSLWYLWDAEAPALRCATAADADVVRYLEHDEEVSFEVSTNDPPYCGVRGRGRATVSVDEEKRLLRTLLDRYLGGTDSALAARLLRPEREEVEIRITPTKLYAWDYAERMTDSDGDGDGDGATRTG